MEFWAAAEVFDLAYPALDKVRRLVEPLLNNQNIMKPTSWVLLVINSASPLPGIYNFVTVYPVNAP